jgi:hypothetical protein
VGIALGARRVRAELGLIRDPNFPWGDEGLL